MEYHWGTFAAGFCCGFATLFIGLCMLWWGAHSWAAYFSIKNAQHAFDMKKADFDYETAKLQREQLMRHKDELHTAEMMRIRLNAGLPPEGT